MNSTIGFPNGTKALAVAALALLAACGGGGGGGPSEPPVTPSDAYSANTARLVEMGRRTTVSEPRFGSVLQSAGVNVAAVRSAGITRRDDGGFTAEINRADGSRTALNSFDHLYASVPTVSPTGRTAEIATLLDYGGGHITVASGTIDHDPNDLGDWMAGGYWLHIEGDWRNGGVDRVEIGAVVDGPEISRPASPPTTGTASYRGLAGGIYAVRYGSDSTVPGASEAGAYEGTLTATADFAAGTVSGEIGGLRITGVTEHPDEQTEEFSGVSSTVRLVLEPGRIGSGGSVTGRLRCVSPELRIVSTEGSWGARLSAVDDTDGNPRVIAGTHGGTARTVGGTEAVLIGVHAGATPRRPF